MTAIVLQCIFTSAALICMGNRDLHSRFAGSNACGEKHESRLQASRSEA